MRFGVLGPVAVWTRDGAPVRIPEAKVRALLALLLAHQGRPVSVDRLLAGLWGERLPGNPVNTLQTKVSQLRSTLERAESGGRALLAREPAGYLLRADTDADRFRELVAKARGTGDLAARARWYREALDLWRGPAYADFADEPFAVAAIRRLAEDRLAAQEEHAETRLALGEHRELAGELAELVAAHPLRERLRAVQLRALYRSGRQTEALAGYADLRDRLADELGLDPSPELVALQRAILTQDDRAEPPPPTGNLPAEVTELVGRQQELADVRTALDSARLVTLTGPGGVGKTRLAIEAARRLAPGYPDGVWLVELAGLGKSGAPPSVEVLARAVLDVLGIREDTGSGPAGKLAYALRGKKPLVLLDNCEHLVEQAAELAGLLLRAAPGLRLLATSQEALGVTGESLVVVPPLALDGAVRLFTDRAAASAPGSGIDTAAVTEICRKLDGIPLAIELAATRVRALGVPELLARLDDRFAVLGAGRRDAPERQRTLRAMIDWSWDLLTPAEQVVLRRLAAHVDGCALDAAEAVCAGDGVPRTQVVGLLARLIDRSLVVVTEAPDGERRYRLLESVAAYCTDRLREAGECAELADRHLTFYLDLAERAEPELWGHDQRRWLRRLDADTANLRAALDTALGRDNRESALRLVNALTWYWFLRGKLTEARHALTAALADGAAPGSARAATWLAAFDLLGSDTGDRAGLAGWADIDDPLHRVRARWFTAYALGTIGDYHVVADTVGEVLTEFERLGDTWGVAAALIDRATCVRFHGDLAAAERDARRADALFGELGDRWGRLQASFLLGSSAEIVGELRAAARQHEAGLRMAEELGLWPEVSYQLSWLGRVALLEKDFRRATELHERARKLAADQSFLPGEIYAETGLALIARRTGALDEAERYLRRALAWHRTVPFQSGNTLILAELGFVAEHRGDHAEADRLQREGLAIARRLGEPRAIALGLEGLAGARALAGSAKEAARLLGAASAARASVGAPLPAAERGDVDRITEAARKVLGGKVFDEEFAAGLAVGAEEAGNYSAEVE